MQQLRFMAHVKSLKRADETFNQFCNLVAKYAWPSKLELLFAFSYKRSVSMADNGWNFYHSDSEYKRQVRIVGDGDGDGDGVNGNLLIW